MRSVALLALAAAAAAGPILAQSNTVPGLDGRLSLVDDLTYWGRRGAAHPGGEVGMSMLNTMCNPGSIPIPWFAAMQSNHPKFGFLIVRETDGRMVQINDWSFCKHAFVSTNFSGACGSCQSNPLGGSQMGVNCSDTYGAGNNGDRFWLGPPEEIDPWLGTWNPVGSHFDRGEPAVTGPAATDGARSPAGPYDEVEHRVTVKESELLVPGKFYYGIQLIHQGEAVANRGDNLASRGFNPSWTGSGWSLSNNAVGMVYGSILQHWSDATLDSAGNGADDGRFYVAVRVTPIAGGQYHYEYAVHNVDNSRGGASFRIPIDAAATASNFGFRDIDDDPLNNWTGTRVGNEIVFSGPSTNPQNWNTVFNCWFDSSRGPGNSLLHVDEARPGPGALTVSVPARGPSGPLVAFNATVGTGCAPAVTPCTDTIYEMFNSPASFDMQNGSWSLNLVGTDYLLGAATGAFVAPAGAALPMGDDSEIPVNLPFSLAYPGGTTSTIWVCSNGFASPSSNGADYNPNVAGFVGGSARWAPAWHDFDPTSGGQVRVDSSPTEVRVTWQNVANFFAPGTSTFQMRFQPSGRVDVYYQSMSTAGNQYLVGWTSGTTADPGGSDFSASIGAGVQLCVSNSILPPLTLEPNNRPVLGTTLTMTTSNIPTGSALSVLLYSATVVVPPIDLSAIGMQDCQAHMLNPVAWASHIGPVGVAIDTIPLPASPAFLGAVVAWQSVSFSPGANPAGLLSSNGVLTVLANL
ncbi:MAG: hypothetical protein AB7O97_14175 [Planctomycetota bacterium]